MDELSSVMGNQVPKESPQLQEKIFYKAHSFGGFHVVPIIIWKRLSFLLLENKTAVKKIFAAQQIVLFLYINSTEYIFKAIKNKTCNSFLNTWHDYD